MLAVERLRSKADVALIIERVTWAAWIKKETVGPHLGGPHVPVMPTSIDIGSYVADRLNKLGVADLAGVTLGANWYTPHSSNYAEKLLQWANTYRPSLLTGK